MVDLQARAGGGRLPQLYEATVHLQLRLGLVSRLLSLVSCAAHQWFLDIEPSVMTTCSADHMVCQLLQVVNDSNCCIHGHGLTISHADTVICRQDLGTG